MTVDSGLGFLPVATINTVFYLCIEVFSCSVQQMERGSGFVIDQHLLCQVYIQCLLAVTQGQR